MGRLALGRQLLNRQREIVAARERTCMGPADAGALLDVLQQVQETREVEHNRLLKALAERR